MPKLKYVGPSHYRVISADDFANIGADGQPDTVWDRDNLRGRDDASQVNEVNQAAVSWLLENETADWEVVDDHESPSKSRRTGGDDQAAPVV